MFPAFLRRSMQTVVAATMVAAATGVPAQSSVLLHNIMSSLPASPYVNQTVRTTGIVLGVMTTGGFYLSSPDSEWDGVVSTAEGMPVFPSQVAACNAVAVGDAVTVTGTVVNSTLVDAANTPATGMNPSACSKSGSATVSRSINLGNSGALASFGDALKFTGMSATDGSFAAISPTGGTSANNAVTSTGQFWAVLAGNLGTNNHLFRKPGIAGDEYVPAGAPVAVPTWSGNPQRVLIDTTTFGGMPIDITAGQTITCTPGSGITAGPTTGIGLIDYTLGYARLLIFKTTTCGGSGTVQPSSSAMADPAHFKVGTLDVNAFLGPGSILSASSVLPTALPKALQAVTGVFGSPDIFALQQVSDQASLQYLADAANTANGGTTSYVATVLGGNQINSGFLVNTNSVLNTGYTEAGVSATYTTAGGSTAMLWDFPPLVMTGEFYRTGRNYPVTVMNVEFASRDNIGDPVLGPDVRARRAAQAAAVSALVQQYQGSGSNVIVAGNFNGYEFNDGYVDVVGIVDGAPAPQGMVTLFQATSTTSPLTDFTTQVPADTRYNVIENGNAAALEHILASATVIDSTSAPAALASYGSVTQPHFSADYAAISANDPATPAGLTPHDGLLVTFTIPPVPTTASLTPAGTVNFGDVYIGGSSTRQLTFTNTTGYTSTVSVTGINISGASASDFSAANTCTSLGMGQSCTITISFAPSAAGVRTGIITMTSDSTHNPVLTASLTGNGLDTTATLSPASADFGTQILGTSSGTQIFTWTNPSSIPLGISGVDTSGDYSVAANTCFGQIAARSSCYVSVVFTPAALGTRTGTLTVGSRSSLNGTLTAPLTGIGVPSVQASAYSLNFGNVDVTTSSAPQTLAITNNTGVALALSGFVTTGDYSQTNTCGSALAPHGTCTVTVVFTPTALGTRTGSVSLMTGTISAPSITVALSGNGVDFAVAVAPTSGNVIAGFSVSPGVMLTPMGGFNAPVTMSCTTTASGTGCAYAKSTFTLSGATPDALTITTTSKYTVIGYGALLFGPEHRSLLSMLLGLCCMGALLPGKWYGRSLKRLPVALAAVGLLAGGLSGCSGKLPDLNSPYTAPGKYTIQVTATDGILTHTAAYALTVTAK